MHDPRLVVRFFDSTSRSPDGENNDRDHTGYNDIFYICRTSIIAVSRGKKR